MKRTSMKYFLWLSVCWLLPTGVFAQNLATFVNDETFGASELQRSVGVAVQSACGALNNFGLSQGLQNGGFDLPGAQGDLFARCNEMVQTAQTLQGATGRGRDLGIGVSGLLAVLQQVGGEEQATQGTLTTRVTNGQFSNIAGRLNAVRLGGASAAIGGRVAASGSYAYPDRAQPGYHQLSLDSRAMSGGAAAADMAGSRFGWFLEGSFNTGDRDQTVSEDGFDFDSSSVTAGIDYLFDSGVVGVSFGVDAYDADFVTNALVAGGSVEIDGISGSAFGALYRGNWYLDGIVSAGSLDTDSTRLAVYPSNNPACTPVPCPAQNDTLRGSTDGDFVAAGATIGYEVTQGKWDISPTLSLSYRNIDMDAYTETDPMGGGLTLSYAGQGFDSFRSIAGLAFTGNFSRSFGVLSPQFRVEWHHEFEDDPSRLVAKYAVEEQLADAGVVGAAGAGVFALSQCISCFVINGDKVDTNFGLIGFGLSAVLSQRIQLYGTYDALIGLNNLDSNAFSVGIRGQF